MLVGSFKKEKKPHWTPPLLCLGISSPSHHHPMLCPFVYYALLFLLLLISSLLPSLQHLPTLASEMRLVFVLLCKELYHCSIQWLKGNTLSLAAIISRRAFSNMCYIKKKVVNQLKVESVEEEGEEEEGGGMSALDLPDLVLENILGRLSPDGLCNMALVCRSMRDWCRSDRLWERHMRERWGRVVVGKATRRQWQCDVSLRKESLGDDPLSEGTRKGWIESLSLSCSWPLSWLCCDFAGGREETRKPLPVDSIMSRYLALEDGRFWFPAQVYNRENGHVGFMLSCYDAELSYDKRTDTFFARYPPHGRRTVMVEDGVTWGRIRASPVDTPASELHVSDCLNSLQPGDHIEIQWRRNKEFPYGWWYAVVGHMPSCDQNELRCLCHDSDIVVLEFNHYAPGSRWRQTFISRKNHREKGNETDGFYGGIRKLQGKEEISMWKKFWPKEILE